MTNYFSDIRPVQERMEIARHPTREEIQEKILKALIRCYRTGNPVGTDTWTGSGCWCQNCSEYRKDINMNPNEFYRKYFHLREQHTGPNPPKDRR